MSEEPKKKKGASLKNACISALIASLILTFISLAGGYFVYLKVVKPSLDEAGIEFNLKDIPDIIAKYQELLEIVKEYEAMHDQYVTEQNWDKLDELNRSYEEHKDEIEELKLLMDTYNIKIE